MAVFKVKTKNKVDIDKKPRVYFTCHPDDFEKHFKKICGDIFKTHDCAIYYTEDMAEVIAEDEKTVDLGRNNLFVVPVTFKLLVTPNRAMDEDIPYALEEHIPVLPIMMEPGIDAVYSRPDKFGELQYLNPYSTDLTEISYEEKLKKYLESVLISDELAKRVRAAFDAYIFLSYRKKDRKYANELMRLIHSNPECRDIAIWFDEFLTPGESFKENIEKILEDCKLFTLLVTPQLLEKVVDENGEERDNYVISTELPLARKNKAEKGTDIFAVEMEVTDKEALSAINIEEYVNCRDPKFRAQLLDSISRIAITTNNTPEHNFLIGLAYLDGIDVEVDRERALNLIISAADENMPEAIDKLIDMYVAGNGSVQDYRKAIHWSKKKIEILTGEWLKNKDPEIGIKTVSQLIQCAALFMSNFDHPNAKFYYKEAVTFAESVWDGTVSVQQKATLRTKLISADKSLGCIATAEADFVNAEQYFLEAIRVAKFLTETTPNISAWRELIFLHIGLGNVCQQACAYAKARKYYLQGLEIAKLPGGILLKKLFPEFTVELAALYMHIGSIDMLTNNMLSAKDNLEKSISYYNKIEDQTGDAFKYLYELSSAYRVLAAVKLSCNDCVGSEACFINAYERAERLYQASNNLDVLALLLDVINGLSTYYIVNDNFKQAKRYNDMALEYSEPFLRDDVESLFVLSILAEMYRCTATISFLNNQENLPVEIIEKYHDGICKIRAKGAVEYSDILMASYHRMLGYMAMSKNEVSLAKENFQKCLTLCEKAEVGSLDQIREIMLAHLALGKIAQEKKEKALALAHYQKAFDSYVKSPDHLYGLVNDEFIWLGNEYFKLKENKKARDVLETELHKIEERVSVGDPKYKDLTIICCILGRVYKRLGNVEKAAKHLVKATTLWREISESARTKFLVNKIITAFEELGGIYTQQNDWSKVCCEYSKAVSVFEQYKTVSNSSNEKRYLARLYKKLGEAYEKIGDTETAKKCYNESLYIELSTFA